MSAIEVFMLTADVFPAHVPLQIPPYNRFHYCRECGRALEPDMSIFCSMDCEAWYDDKSGHPSDDDRADEDESENEDKE